MNATGNLFLLGGELPAALVVGWVLLLAARRRIPVWFFPAAAGACVASLLLALVSMLVGRSAGAPEPQQPLLGGSGDALFYGSIANAVTGLGTVLVLLVLTGIIGLVRRARRGGRGAGVAP